jgi:head-tail adaptor
MDFLLIYYFLCCDIKTIDCFGVCTKYWGDLSKVWAGLRGFKGRMVIEARTIEEGTASLRVLEGL